MRLVPRVLVLAGTLAGAACGGSDEGNLFGSGGSPGDASTTGGAGATGGTGVGATGGTGVGATGGATGGTGVGATGGTGVGATGGTGVGATGGTGAGATGGTGAVGGTATGGTGTGAAGSGGTGGGPEDCLNGVDDNGNGLADCSDPQCQPGFTCVTPAPAGWGGVGWIDSEPSVPCPAPFGSATLLFDQTQIGAPPPSCGCACKAPTGIGCAVSMSCSAGASCGSGLGSNVPVGCSQRAVPAPNGTNACIVPPPLAVNGSCAPSAPALITPLKWEPSSRTCRQPVGGACSDGTQQCIAKLGQAKGPCIAAVGDLPCPTNSPYGKRTLYWDGKATDTRGCSGAGCTCGAPQAATCGCTGSPCGVAIHASNSCNSGGLKLIPPNNTCTSFSDSMNGDSYWGALRQNIGVTAPGTCPPSGSASPTGGVTPTGPITVCCL